MTHPVRDSLASLKGDLEELRERQQELTAKLEDLEETLDLEYHLKLTELERCTLLDCLERLNLSPWEEQIRTLIRDAI